MEYFLDHPWALGGLLLIVLAVVLELGRLVAAHAKIEQKPQHKEQLGTIRDGLFVLLSLLLGFSLTFATARAVERRSLLVEEATAIGTTYLRAATLPPPYRDHSRQLLRDYADSCLDLNSIVYGSRPTEAARHASSILEELWTDAAAVAQADHSAVIAVYLSSLNETIDLHEKRVAAFENHVPKAVWFMVLGVSLIAVFTRGATFSGRYWLTLMLVPVTIALVVGLTADLDTPTHGLLRLDQRPLLRLKAEMSVDSAK